MSTGIRAGAKIIRKNYSEELLWKSLLPSRPGVLGSRILNNYLGLESIGDPLKISWVANTCFTEFYPLSPEFTGLYWLPRPCLTLPHPSLFLHNADLNCVEYFLAHSLRKNHQVYKSPSHTCGLYKILHMGKNPLLLSFLICLLLPHLLCRAHILPSGPTLHQALYQAIYSQYFMNNLLLRSLPCMQ